MIDRGFVRIEEGLVHYRTRRSENSADNLPLYMVHAGPVSSLSLEPLIEALSSQRTIYAPDTLGFGDSAPPSQDTPDIEYYVDSVVRVMDALSLEKTNFFGSHTGVNIGCELAIRHPNRVHKLIFEGAGLYDEVTKKDLLTNYAPKKMPDEYGAHLMWAWQYLKNQSLFYPHYKQDPAHRLSGPVFETTLLNAFTIDLLKALTTYHKGYEAVFRHPLESRLPLVQHPALFMAHEYDPMKEYLCEAAALVVGAQSMTVSAQDGLRFQADLIERFLDRS